jgi:hypothetical protein
MQAAGLPAIMDLHTYFVGTYDGNGQFDCMHGEDECLGDIVLLCGDNVTRNQVPYGWWKMETCMENDADNIPQNAQSCAQQANLNWNAISACANGQQGINLFIDSINNANNAGIYETPTIVINGQVYPGGPDDPLTTICQAYTGVPPSGCSGKVKVA